MGFGFRRFSSNKWTPVITGVAIGIYSGMVALWLPLAGDHGPAVRAVAVCTGSARRGATAPLLKQLLWLARMRVVGDVTS